MYQRPDFIKVEIDISDNFANYTTCVAYDFKQSFMTITDGSETCFEYSIYGEGIYNNGHGGWSCYQEPYSITG